MEIKEGDYVVRVWPSGAITMGKASYECMYKSPNEAYFIALESYSSEGGVTKDNVYGTLNSINYIHRLATPAEISVFKEYGEVRNREDEIKQHKRDIAIEDMIFESKVVAVIDFLKKSNF